MRLLFLCNVTVCLLLCGTARADDAPAATPALTPAEITLGTFAVQNPKCQAWTDACVLCRRLPDGKTACSTPGIACTPVDITCVDPKTP